MCETLNRGNEERGKKKLIEQRRGKKNRHTLQASRRTRHPREPNCPVSMTPENLTPIYDQWIMLVLQKPVQEGRD